MRPLQPEQPIDITLTAQQWNAILAALGEAPYRIAAPIIGSIVEQVERQSGGPWPQAVTE
jgi:hypothetical protein